MSEAATKKEIKAFKEEVAEQENVEQMMEHLFDWHSHKVAGLEHLMKIPVGIQVSLNDAEPLVMSEDIHKGFVIGLTLALIELGTLPFSELYAEDLDEEVIH